MRAGVAARSRAQGVIGQIKRLFVIKTRIEAFVSERARRILDGMALEPRDARYDGEAGIQELAGNATLLYYMTEEAQEGRNAYVEKRKPDFGKFKRVP